MIQLASYNHSVIRRRQNDIFFEEAEISHDFSSFSPLQHGLSSGIIT